MIVIAGGYDQDQGGMGGFQEWNQVCYWLGISIGAYLILQLQENSPILLEPKYLKAITTFQKWHKV